MKQLKPATKAKPKAVKDHGESYEACVARTMKAGTWKNVRFASEVGKAEKKAG